MAAAPHVMIVGVALAHQLAASYARAFEELGWRVTTFDLEAAIGHHTRLSRAGALFHAFVPIESWVRKANRELLIEALGREPDLVLIVGHVSARVGALSQLRAARPSTKMALVWPDTLLNLGRAELECLPMYDLVASYSRASVEPFERLGARRVEWIPLAADPTLHRVPPMDEAERARWRCEALFVGNFRPERERSILALRDAGIPVRVWGAATWKKRARRRERVAEYWQGRELVGADFAAASSCAQVCLNLIDPTNFPAANMRLFESSLFGRPTVSSRCPEMEATFRHEEHTVYVRDDAELVATVRRLLADEEACRRMGDAARELVLAEHTYRHRAERIASTLGM